MSDTNSDEYSWRKYGQKEIHSSKFPRSYFRCTHKHDQGCQATKQVQKSEEDPSLLVITYLGLHTCTDNLNMIQNLTMPSSSVEPSIISFGSNTSHVTQEPSIPKRRETDEEVHSNPRPGTPSSDFFDLPSLYEGPLLEPLMSESELQLGGDAGARNLDMSFMFDSFSFEEGGFAFDDQGDLFRA